jgi:general L-amino acid transport system substrate-binding protein
VRWVQFAQLHAENLKLASTNVDGQADTANPDARRLLGREGDLGQSVGLDNCWAYFIVRQAGNYGEMFERTLTSLGLPRGRSALWTQGGFQFDPAVR